jgi:lactoylglutathione lyase
MPQLTLLVLRCRDLQQSRRFYSALGLELTAEKHGDGPIHYSSKLGSTVLELYPTSKVSSSVRIGLEVRDVMAAVEAVRMLGAHVDREPGSAQNSALVRDPDGNQVELVLSPVGGAG